MSLVYSPIYCQRHKVHTVIGGVKSHHGFGIGSVRMLSALHVDPHGLLKKFLTIIVVGVINGSRMSISFLKQHYS